MNRSLLVLVGLAATGCTAGKYFDPPSVESVLLNQTMRQEIVERFGPPYKEGSAIKNGCTLKTLSYVYASNGSGHNGSSTIPAKAMVFTFTTVSSPTSSSTPSSRPYRVRRRQDPRDRKGETTRDESSTCWALRRECVFPVVEGKQDGSSTPIVRQKKFLGRFHIYLKELVVSFGPDGKVSDLKFMSGEK